MTPAEQRRTTIANKRRGEGRLARALTPWVNSVVAEYRRGKVTISEDLIAELRIILNKNYIAMARDVLGIDIREWKQGEELTILERIYRSIATTLTALFSRRASATTQTVTSTATWHMERISANSTPEARAQLLNLMTSQKLIVATTEAQFVVEGTRRAAVVAVSDPLNNSLEQIAGLIEAGDINQANRLARQSLRLAKLPTSVQQDEKLRIIKDTMARAITPITQAEAIANLRGAAEKFGEEKKTWLTIGDGKVRESHVEANGQKQPIDKPFVLPGGLLQYPGDGSLGADAGETINCRCMTLYGEIK